VDGVSGEIDRQNAVTVIRLSGRLRPRDVPDLRSLLLKCLAECPAGIVVDLAALTVSNPILLTVFPAVLGRAATWPAVPVVLAAPSHATALALHRSAAARTVPVRPTVEAAIEVARSGAPLGRLRIFLPPTTAAAAEARKFTRDACAAWNLDAVADEAILIVSELSENAARHACTEFVLTLSYRGPYLHVAVSDGAPAPARKQTGTPADPASPALGRGLRLVDAFAVAWGTLPTADGKTTWATIRIN
jgi:hypothetical protein